MRAALFTGPTLAGETVDGLDVYPPARLGSVFQAVEAGYDCLLIVDGYFGNCPSVWHKEILFALSKGVAVLGCSSIGALRAAELHPFGMTGHGLVFRLYRSGAITGDDEVCLSHGPRETGYVHLSVPAINLRVSLRRLRRNRQIGPAEETAAFSTLRNVHFSQRSWQRMEAELANARFGSGFHELVRSHLIDVKKLDAISLLEQWRRLASPAVRSADVEDNVHWRRQFVEQQADIPSIAEEIEV